MTVFRDIAEFTGFVPPPSMNSFVKEKKIGVTLLHSHHGYSELFYFENKSRPATTTDKNSSIPCSWYVRVEMFVPYEWTNEPELLLPHHPELNDKLAEEINLLQKTSGVPLGLTIRAGIDCVEVTIKDEPGSHLYLPMEEVKFVEESVVTCISPDKNGKECEVKCRKFHCVFREWH